jgi:hypothetical protein
LNNAKFKSAAAGLVFVSLAIAGGSAFAQDVPRFEVSSHCRKVASFAGSYSESLFGGCMDMEQSAYDGLKTRWARIPAATRAHCLQVASFAGGSYALLQGCVDMEDSAARTNAGRQFRY